MAPVGQTFSHFMQPMQPFEQATRVCAPFWVMPQPVQLPGYTFATPFTTWMASDGQAFSQSP